MDALLDGVVQQYRILVKITHKSMVLELYQGVVICYSNTNQPVGCYMVHQAMVLTVVQRRHK